MTSLMWKRSPSAAGIRELGRLRKRYGPGRWRKMKGVATIRLADGRVRRAELHWYEAHGIGRKEVSASATCQRASHGEGVTVWSGRWEGAAVKSIEAVVTFTRKDGTVTRPLPVTSTLRMRGDLIKDYRIFMDVSPLFAQQA